MSTHYAMNSNQSLTAASAGKTTFYLYGLGVIAEKTDTWSYSLPDGTNTPRQLSTLIGGITLTARYTPWPLVPLRGASQGRYVRNLGHRQDT
ncbi:MAG TPA: hypothetical protein VJ785_13450 [Anaerolineales bacterium]|nr:hypothetical protein [Anaerolineales bacterium]